ncbi:MAG: hypothetical protein GVY29_12610 [Spirochaetes bacterium]|nr:hypothetical protein [Spirochaetota bacterium]
MKVLILAVLCVAAGPLVAQESVARLYRDAAIDLYGGENFTAAETFVNRGLDFAPNHSDLLLLKARLAARDQWRTHESISHFERALAADTFDALSRSPAAADFAELLIRIGHGDRAIRVLTDNLGDQPYQSARAYAALARAYRLAGRPGEANRTVRAGRDRFPDSVELLSFVMSEEPDPDSLLVRRVRALEADTPAYRSLLLRYAAALDNPADRRAEIERYLSLGGSDPVASVLILEVTEEPAAELQRFEELGGLQDKGLIERVFAALPEGETKESFASTLGEITGVLHRDENRDGFVEARYEFARGELMRWTVDADTDGLPEADITLNGRVPLAATIQQNGSYATIRYGDYPDVARIASVDETAADDGNAPALTMDSSVRSPTLRQFTTQTFGTYYQVRPGALKAQILSGEVSWGSDIPDAALVVELAAALPLYTDEVLRNAGYRRHSADDSGVVTDWLRNGRIERRAADRDGNGVIDHRLVFEQGSPVSGVRDANGDGIFEVSEQYEGGELRYIAVDDDGDGIPEYTERHDQASVFSWDLNDDGEIDVEELRRGRETLERKFTGGGE